VFFSSKREVERLRAENSILRSELAATRAQTSDLVTANLRQAEEASKERANLLNRIMALAAPSSVAILNPTPPRTPKPRERQATRWPGYRPNTEAPFVLASEAKLPLNAEN